MPKVEIYRNRKENDMKTFYDPGQAQDAYE
jgi:hypothetical protein